MPDGQTPAFDTVIRGGLVFDGRGHAPRTADVGIKDGRVVAIDAALPVDGATKVVDARDRWVVPGFIDLHTHYDAEIEVAPALSESVRHGVTTVVVGSCSLSMAVGSADDLADMFCRVEAIPDRFVRPLLRDRKSWSTHAEYLAHLDTLPLGPNVAAFAGHSAIRAHAMGLERSLTRARPTKQHVATMERMLEDALDAGYLGCSIQTLPWDKMGGTRSWRSRPLPSTFARWSEYRRLTRILRRRGAVLQGVPNVSTKINTVLFLLESAKLFRDRALKTTIISLMDPRAQPGIHRYAEWLSSFFNEKLGADFRWQALPNVFDLWADGVDLVVFEELGAGTAALHLEDAIARSALLRDPKYRAWFRRQWTSKYLPRAFHRDFNESKILACPAPDGPGVVGKSFADVARERGEHVVDTFLDLAATHGDRLRWYTVMCNESRRSIEEIVRYDDVLIGFSDAGAHLRQMAHYNFPLRMLRLVNDAHKRGEPIMSIERAVHRLTGEIADWLGFDAGHLEAGARADVVVVNPAKLDDALECVDYAAIDGFSDDYLRLVRRNDDAVDAVFVAGARVVSSGKPLADLGRRRTGRVLRRTQAATENTERVVNEG